MHFYVHIEVLRIHVILKKMYMYVSSVESQKGAINIQRCSVENRKGTIVVQSLCGDNTLLVHKETSIVIVPFWLSTYNTCI